MAFLALQIHEAIHKPYGNNKNKLNHGAAYIIRERHSHKQQRNSDALENGGYDIGNHNSVQLAEACKSPKTVIHFKEIKHN